MPEQKKLSEEEVQNLVDKVRTGKDLSLTEFLALEKLLETRTGRSVEGIFDPESELSPELRIQEAGDTVARLFEETFGFPEEKEESKPKADEKRSLLQALAELTGFKEDVAKDEETALKKQEQKKERPEDKPLPLTPEMNRLSRQYQRVVFGFDPEQETQ